MHLDINTYDIPFTSSEDEREILDDSLDTVNDVLEALIRQISILQKRVTTLEAEKKAARDE